LLESGLFFVLGFLVATLLALLLAPPIWRRAVILTRERIERSVPLTLNEIQADKDQLRAEHAMAARRLEISLEKQRTEASEQFVELNNRRDEVLDLKKTLTERDTRIDALETLEAELRNTIGDLEARLNHTSGTLASTKAQLEDRIEALIEMDTRHREMQEDVDSQKIELVSRETKLDNMQNEALKTRKQLKETRSDLDRVKSELRVVNGNLEQEKKRYEKLLQKNTEQQGRYVDLEGRLERRNNDLARLRDEMAGDNSSAPSASLLRLQSTNEELKAEISRLTTELNALQEKAASQIKGDANAIVREKISELAAKVTALTARQEGHNSPINVALKKPAPPQPKARSQADQAAADVLSLAERIKAMQLSDQDA